MDVLTYEGLTRFKGWLAGLLALKVNKETGKGLSTNDYTTAEKQKLSGIESGAQVNTVTSVNGQTGDVTIESGGEKTNNANIVVIGNKVVETDLVTGDVTTTTFNSGSSSSDLYSIVEQVKNGSTIKSTKTTTFDGNNIYVRYT